MDSASQLWAPSGDLEKLRARFPDYEITEDKRVTPPRWHAVARNLNVSPHSVITADLGELVKMLSGARA